MEWLRKTGDNRVSEDEFSDNELSDDESSPTPLRQEYEIISIELLWYFLSWWNHNFEAFLISILWAQDRPKSPVENRLNNLNVLNRELKSDIQKLEDKVEKLQENLRNQGTVISHLKTVNETIQIEVTGIVKDLQIQKARNDELEKRYNATVKC